ncbi:CLUMA_CG020742, isoform A [Clunio marinus]|uniref:CLUMA_CG020742, isoform A n=1 Tax=Clunio marinus TaxID=568069 RepID=A0A1J1J7P0_9DIPT|nr:CLUMA_CG020742, isoform A [Clunio marinus]
MIGLKKSLKGFTKTQLVSIHEDSRRNMTTQIRINTKKTRQKIFAFNAMLLKENKRQQTLGAVKHCYDSHHK